MIPKHVSGEEKTEKMFVLIFWNRFANIVNIVDNTWLFTYAAESKR